jgi:hypothetical protein
VYHECTAETALSSKLIKACVTSIGTEAVANDIHAMLPTFIEWFVELDGNNEAVSLQVGLSTLCKIEVVRPHSFVFK